ncbi:MAG TPA: DUF433 domain-containing protein [Polyangia bacterium]
MKPKVDIYGGKNPRDLPLYSVAEAARVVRVNPATLRSWVLGRSYETRSGDKNWSPLIQVADSRLGRLSFANLVEVHVLSVLRGKQVRVDRIRSTTRFIRERMGTKHPLADVDTHTDCVDIYVEYLGQLVSGSTAQTVLRPLVERYLERIERDENGIARRLFPITRDDGSNALSVSIDPACRFGRPVLASTNLETATVADRFFAGDSTEVLAADFAIREADVEEAIRFESQLRAA